MFQLLLNLLGHNLDDPEFLVLLESTGAPSVVYDVPVNEVDSLRMFEFFNFGFGLSYNLREKQFFMIGCEYQGRATLWRTMLPFPDFGPEGITSRDTKQSVQRKFAVLPIASKKLKSYARVTYEIQPHQIECLFSGDGRILTGFNVSLLGKDLVAHVPGSDSNLVCKDV